MSTENLNEWVENEMQRIFGAVVRDIIDIGRVERGEVEHVQIQSNPRNREISLYEGNGNELTEIGLDGDVRNILGRAVCAVCERIREGDERDALPINYVARLTFNFETNSAEFNMWVDY